MWSPSSVKQEFLKKWMKGLQVYNATKMEMNILERKNAIKLSADVAMASTRISSSAASSWSRAIVAKASNDARNKPIVARVLSNVNAEPTEPAVIKKNETAAKNNKLMLMIRRNKRVRSKKILRKSCSSTIRRMRWKAKKCNKDNIAERVISKRTQVLKRLVPGGELMDEICLMRETLDYILSLKLQVDVMRNLANAAQKLDTISSS